MKTEYAMAIIHDTLRNLLQSPALQREIADAFYVGFDSPEEFDAMPLRNHVRRALNLIEDESHDVPYTAAAYDNYSDDAVNKVRANVRDILQIHVVDNLPTPAAITADELCRLAMAQLAGVPLLDSEDASLAAVAFNRFVEFAVADIGRYQPEGRFTLGKWENYVEDKWEEICDSGFLYAQELRLWSSPSGLRMSIANPYYGCCAPDRYDEGYPVKVVGHLSGFFSEQAMTLAAEQCQGIVESIAQSVQLSHTALDRESESSVTKRQTAYVGAPGFGFCSLAFLVQGDGRLMFSRCLSAFWLQKQTERNAQETVLDRLRNAVVLLAHADEATADPIALSLSFAAIEALVCEEGELPVNKQITRHVSTLLVQSEGDRDAREATRKNRERVIAKLYDIRCQVMHGNRINASDDANRCVRRIAAGVIRAIVCWMAHRERMGGDISWRDFMDEVLLANRKGDTVVGLPELGELIPQTAPN